MKKITLLVTALVVFGSAAKASEIDRSAFERPINIAEAEPISFVERGIEFIVFADGQFDFSTRPAIAGDIYYRTSPRASVNRTHGAPGQSGNFGVRVEHDNYGRVRRIGNVFINYDAANRIKRIGSVYMSYNRFALAQVGGLQIRYNGRGQIVGYSGSVNGNQAYAANYNGNNYGDYGNGNAPVLNDDYYYYKTDGTKAVLDLKK